METTADAAATRALFTSCTGIRSCRAAQHHRVFCGEQTYDAGFVSEAEPVLSERTRSRLPRSSSREGETAHATGHVETRRPEPKTASDSPGMPKAAPRRCCAHGGSRGTGARWRLRSFIREDNANPNRGSCADTLPTAKTRAASGRDGGCEASSGKITPRSGVRSTRSPDAGQAATIPPADTAAPHTDRRRTAARTGNGRSRNDDRQHRDNNRCTD